MTQQKIQTETDDQITPGDPAEVNFVGRPARQIPSDQQNRNTHAEHSEQQAAGTGSFPVDIRQPGADHAEDPEYRGLHRRTPAGQECGGSGTESPQPPQNTWVR